MTPAQSNTVYGPCKALSTLSICSVQRRFEWKQTDLHAFQWGLTCLFLITVLLHLFICFFLDGACTIVLVHSKEWILNGLVMTICILHWCLWWTDFTSIVICVQTEPFVCMAHVQASSIFIDERIQKDALCQFLDRFVQPIRLKFVFVFLCFF